jgi:hypothetical protein
VKNALHQFQHDAPKQKIYSPSKYTPPQYGAKLVQLTNDPDRSPRLSPDQTTRLQKVNGKFLYYARAVDGTMMHGLNDLVTQTTTGTQIIVAAMEHFLNYCATNPDAALLY